jgi:hypothetical protein
MRQRGLWHHLRSCFRAIAIGVPMGILSTASFALAHGGMAEPNELGPPLLTSAALGFACYWLVILWPSSKRKNSAPSPGGRRSRRNRRGGRSVVRRNGESEHLSPITKVAGRGRS